MFERLSGIGVHVTSVSPARFEGSGLTVAALRGARFVPVPDEHVAAPGEAEAGPDRREELGQGRDPVRGD